MDPLSLFPLTKIKYVLTDIDGTLTSGGQLVSSAYDALWKLKDAGFVVIPVTGGGAGTAIHAIRSWPIDAIITESGALAYVKERECVKAVYHPNARIKAVDNRSLALIDELREKIPNFKLAMDQFSRLFDIAVDYHEEQPFFNDSEIETVFKVASEHGAGVRKSSIHLNVFFGSYDKIDMTEYLFDTVFNIQLSDVEDTCIYVGDAPNDEQMFLNFRNSIGVANISKYLDIIQHKPSYITSKNAGEGFAEIAEMLLERCC